MIRVLFLFFRVFIFCQATANGAPMMTSSCCSLSKESCRATCEEVSLVALATNDYERWKYLKKLSSLCPPNLVPFWSCLNETLHEIDKGYGFFGRSCCTLPRSQACILVCLQAKTEDDLVPACLPNEEFTFYLCLNHQKAGQKCCKETDKTECFDACKEYFSSTVPPSDHLKNYVTTVCLQDNQIIQCIQNYSYITPEENPLRNIHCCDKSSDTDCKKACLNILKTQTVGQEIVDNMIAAGCGLPLPHDMLWQCFLTSTDTVKSESKETLPLNNFGMDNAKLQCCIHAATMVCQKLCLQVFSHEWEKNWGEFDEQCQYNIAESAMMQCLTEVEEPCELGCDRLSYCANFNYRPVDFFRNCDIRTDNAAQRDVELWHQGVIHMPMVDIPVLDIASCFPNLWKTVACALQIKPCDVKHHNLMICRNDCLKLLSKCVDQSRLQNNQSANSLCEVLSPAEHDSPCISLNTYLSRSPYRKADIDITYVCKHNTCKQNEVCLRHHNCHFNKPCSSYICKPGCKMGAMSHHVVPGDTYIQVSHIYNGNHCQRVCYCNKLGMIEHCTSLSCYQKKSCILNGKEIAHGSRYFDNCTLCYCFAGELRCSKVCQNNIQHIHHRSEFSCRCLDHYVPVCGINGKTYPSACSARCAGLKDDQFDSGICTESNPCISKPCGHNRCLIRRQVCLSVKYKCSQYLCVNAGSECEKNVFDPVCDTENEEFPNLCTLLKKKKKFGYFGKCVVHCQKKGKACGHNGQTYISECAAWADRMLIDYRTPCIINYYVIDTSNGSSCLGIKCQPLPSQYCSGTIPPNSCCPICGTALQLFYSQNLLDQILDVIQTVDPSAITRVTETLQKHIKIAECVLSSYLSFDSTIVVLITPNVPLPSKLQIDACVQESKKLHALINQKSPTILTEFPLSSVTGSIIIETSSLLSKSESAKSTSIVTLVLLLNIFLMTNCNCKM